MKNLLTAPCLGILALTTLLLGGCKKDPESPALQSATGTVAVEITNVAGTKPVALDGTAYATPGGETFTITTLKYYISNILLTKADGSSYAVPRVYHLVDASKQATTKFTLDSIPAGSYTGMKFTVGVDSTTTKADPLSLTGDLNPANNMYWAWASGHIFLKLEGTVTSAGNKALTAHIGGYRAPYSAIVTAAPPLPAGQNLLVHPDLAPTIQLSADVLKLFDGKTHIALSSFPTAMSPSAASVQVAQNYAAGMFTVKRIYAD